MFRETNRQILFRAGPHCVTPPTQSALHAIGWQRTRQPGTGKNLFTYTIHRFLVPNGLFCWCKPIRSKGSCWAQNMDLNGAAASAICFLHLHKVNHWSHPSPPSLTSCAGWTHCSSYLGWCGGWIRTIWTVVISLLNKTFTRLTSPTPTIAPSLNDRTLLAGMPCSISSQGPCKQRCSHGGMLIFAWIWTPV